MKFAQSAGLQQVLIVGRWNGAGLLAGVGAAWVRVSVDRELGVAGCNKVA